MKMSFWIRKATTIGDLKRGDDSPCTWHCYDHESPHIALCGHSYPQHPEYSRSYRDLLPPSPFCRKCLILSWFGLIRSNVPRFLRKPVFGFYTGMAFGIFATVFMQSAIWESMLPITGGLESFFYSFLGNTGTFLGYVTGVILLVAFFRRQAASSREELRTF